MLYYFKSKKQLKKLFLSQPHLYKKERTNLREEEKTKAVIRIKAALVDLTIPFHVIACCLKSTKAKN
jgi:hypothetical protein